MFLLLNQENNGFKLMMDRYAYIILLQQSCTSMFTRVERVNIVKVQKQQAYLLYFERKDVEVSILVLAGT